MRCGGKSATAPIRWKRGAKRQGAATAKAKAMTFQQCARAYITAHQAAWSAQHAAQWASSVEAYCYPVFGSLPVADIDTVLVMKVVEPLWTTATETASRMRGRIENILDCAKTRELRSGENPARRRGHLDNLLPKKAKVAPVQHHPALPYGQVAGFMADLRREGDVSARALELAILTASRSGEVLKAKWSEFDLDERLWTIPGERMKAGKEHRVPLSDAAMAIIEQQRAIRSGDYVFAAQRGGGLLGKNALSRVLKRLGRPDLTVHGFRSTFSDWCAESTSTPSEVREMALVHTIGNLAEAAYRRGDLFAKRRALSEAWAAYCDGAEVVSLAEVRSA